nr:hypothetical protein [Paenibacillus xylanexedens]
MPRRNDRNCVLHPNRHPDLEGGLGSTLGTIANVIGLGTMLGKMMAESGGAGSYMNRKREELLAPLFFVHFIS